MAVWLALALACEPSPLPRIEVGGAAGDSLEFTQWEAVRSLGVVTKYRAKATGRAGGPPGSIAYALIDPAGQTLSQGAIEVRSAYDFREPFRAGDSFTLSIPAYRGESTGRRVARIRLDIAPGARRPQNLPPDAAQMSPANTSPANTKAGTTEPAPLVDVFDGTTAPEALRPDSE